MLEVLISILFNGLIFIAGVYYEKWNIWMKRRKLMPFSWKCMQTKCDAKVQGNDLQSVMQFADDHDKWHKETEVNDDEQP